MFKNLRDRLSDRLTQAVGIAIVAIACVLFFKWIGATVDSLVALIGVVVGAAIVVGVQHSGAIRERKHQLRLAAVDRRLVAHQEAFALWRKLVRHVNDESQIGGVVTECQDWWEKNCLYLAPDARKKFRLAYVCANSHGFYMKDREKPELVTQNWDDITAVGEALVKGVELPTLGEDEATLLEDKSE